MSRQDQRVDEGGTAIQAGGNVNISTGMTPSQMAEIMVALAQQLSSYHADAEKKVAERLEHFKHEILEEFAKPNRADPDAFKDPDFQYLINRAQHAYARSGDENVGETLVQMIAERSRCKQRNRLALSLNMAVETVAILTENEFAELSLLFILLHTRNFAVRNQESFANYIREYITPLLPNISTEISSYQYLVAQQCASINNFITRPLHQIFTDHYGGVFSDGFNLEQLRESLRHHPGKISAVLYHTIPCLKDKSKLQFNALNKDMLKDLLKGLSLDESDQQNLVGLFQSTTCPEHQFMDRVSAFVPEYRELHYLWTTTPLQQLNLSSLGITIGHANIKRTVPQFDADLAVWIK